MHDVSMTSGGSSHSQEVSNKLRGNELEKKMKSLGLRMAHARWHAAAAAAAVTHTL